MIEKPERNKLIVQLINKGWSFEMVRKELGLKAKSTVHKIYHRDNGKYSEKDDKKLSTG